MNKEEIDILYSFANDEDCRDVYDWQGFNYEEICPLIDKLIKEDKKYKEIVDKAIEWVKDWTNGANDWFEEDSKPSELLDILKEVK